MKSTAGAKTRDKEGWPPPQIFGMGDKAQIKIDGKLKSGVVSHMEVHHFSPPYGGDVILTLMRVDVKNDKGEVYSFKISESGYSQFQFDDVRNLDYRCPHCLKRVDNVAEKAVEDAVNDGDLVDPNTYEPPEHS